MERAQFAPVVVRRGLSGPARVCADARRWALAPGASVKLANATAVTDLTFSPLAPHDVAAACGPSVAIIDPHARSVRRTLSRFRDIARSPDYKPDGRLLVAGCDNSTVQLFDMSSRAVLRVFNGHEGYVCSLFCSFLCAYVDSETYSSL
jgi:WD40 repeat protein